MLIGFIGCPNSGKTTTAAQVFADLKQLGISSEFLPEQARYHIAKKRWSESLSPSQSVPLQDEDQEKILDQQAKTESIFKKACGQDVILLTDTCTYNSLLYMSPECQDNEIRKRNWNYCKYDLLFYSKPIPYETNLLDPNRVHSETEALKIDSRIPELIKTLNLTVHPVFGNSDQRKQHVLKQILASHLELQK